MKANRFIAGMLVMLGFGSSCGVQRASKSKAPQQPDGMVVVDPRGEPEARVMYGVQVVPFDPDRLIVEPQEIAVGGTVTDVDSGAPLSGVTVLRKNSAVGTVTDREGRYSIRVAIGDTLAFHALGYRYQLHKVKHDRIDVKLRKSSVMDERSTLIEEGKDIPIITVMYGVVPAPFRIIEAQPEPVENSESKAAEQPVADTTAMPAIREEVVVVAYTPPQAAYRNRPVEMPPKPVEKSKILTVPQPK